MATPKNVSGAESTYVSRVQKLISHSEDIEWIFENRASRQGQAFWTHSDRALDVGNPAIFIQHSETLKENPCPSAFVFENVSCEYIEVLGSTWNNIPSRF